jgi:hypothetical protein
MLWRWLEPRIQAMITNRILDFYEGMIRRGQIQMVANHPPADCSQLAHMLADTRSTDRVPEPSA